MRNWKRFIGHAVIAVGLVTVLVGAVNASGTHDIADQVSYLATGVVPGLALVGLGVGLAFVSELRDERVRLGRIEAMTIELKELVSATAAARLAEQPQPVESSTSAGAAR